jgi:photosystem II stability/assembly factor-like uncharacterized protein
VYCAAEGSGIARSLDGGETWSPRNRGYAHHFVRALAGDPRDPAVVYLASNGGGVFRSADEGDTFVERNAGLADATVLDLALDPSAPERLWVGTRTYGAVFTSRDEGESWTRSTATMNSLWAVATARASEVVYAAGYVGFHRTSDGGVTWREAGPGPTDVAALAAGSVDGALVYAASDADGVWRSTDGGTTWVHVGPRGARVASLAIDPHRPGTVYAGTIWGGNALLRSTDQGATWSRVHRFLSGVNAIALDPADERTLFVGMESGSVWSSFDGGTTWDWVSGGDTPIGITRLLVPGHGVLYAGTLDGAYVTEYDDAAEGPQDGNDPEQRGSDDGRAKRRDPPCAWKAVTARARRALARAERLVDRACRVEVGGSLRLPRKAERVFGRATRLIGRSRRLSNVCVVEFERTIIGMRRRLTHCTR